MYKNRLPNSTEPSCHTTLAFVLVESVSTTTLVVGVNEVGGIFFLALHNFLFLRTLVINAGPFFFFPIDDDKLEHPLDTCNYQKLLHK